MKPQIDIFCHYPELKINQQVLRSIIYHVLSEEKYSPDNLNIIFVDDEYLRKLHRDYLKDDSYTDVMAFDLSDKSTKEGEIYISVDRARIHAREYNVPLAEELLRLVIHGILHLKGYDDHDRTGQQKMRTRENYYLQQIENISELIRGSV